MVGNIYKKETLEEYLFYLNTFESYTMFQKYESFKHLTETCKEDLKDEVIITTSTQTNNNI